VTPEPGGALTHSRLTHSLKVAQLARSMAELLLGKSSERVSLLALGGLDADVAEACALAHDLGHPPFGHIGETVLDDFARRKLGLGEGFEGNAQTFRIVARLDLRSPSYKGMDLTAATRCAVLKYPWGRGEREEDEGRHRARLGSDPKYDLHWNKFGFYHEEAADFQQARSIPGVEGELQSVEAAIMDLADDITYALHDLQDFYFAGFLPIPLVIKELRGYMDIRQNPEKARRGGDGTTIVSLAEKLARDYSERFDEELLSRAVKAVFADIDASFSPYFDATPDKVASVTDLVSEKIGMLTSDIRTDRHPTVQRAAVQLGDPLWHQVQVLKHLTTEQVRGRPDMAVYQRAQQHTLRDLLAAIHAWSKEDKRRLPQPLREWQERAMEDNDKRDPNRCLIDFVASLSDQQAVGLHRSLLDGGRSLLHAPVLG
jgi:dGTPase